MTHVYRTARAEAKPAPRVADAFAAARSRRAGRRTVRAQRDDAGGPCDARGGRRACALAAPRRTGGRRPASASASVAPSSPTARALRVLETHHAPTYYQPP